MQLTQLETLLPRLDQLIRDLEERSLPLEERLWDIEAIAQWLDLSVDTVSRHVVTRTGFPQPVQAVAGRLTRRRWFAGEIVRWARQNRGKLPAQRVGRKRAPAA